MLYSWACSWEFIFLKFLLIFISQAIPSNKGKRQVYFCKIIFKFSFILEIKSYIMIFDYIVWYLCLVFSTLNSQKKLLLSCTVFLFLIVWYLCIVFIFIYFHFSFFWNIKKVLQCGNEWWMSTCCTADGCSFRELESFLY